MGVTQVTTTTITCDNCEVDLAATGDNKSPFVIVQSVLRVDAEGNPVQGETIPTRCFCDITCLTDWTGSRD